MAANLRALRSRHPASNTLTRYGDLAGFFTGRSQATAEEGISWIHNLVTGLGIPRLSYFGINRADFPAIIEASAKASSMKANPVSLTAEELETILCSAL
jgi:alcohol dehydrogenase class IV